MLPLFSVVPLCVPRLKMRSKPTLPGQMPTKIPPYRAAQVPRRSCHARATETDVTPSVRALRTPRVLCDGGNRSFDAWGRRHLPRNLNAGETCQATAGHTETLALAHTHTHERCHGWYRHTADGVRPETPVGDGSQHGGSRFACVWVGFAVSAISWSTPASTCVHIMGGPRAGGSSRDARAVTRGTANGPPATSESAEPTPVPRAAVRPAGTADAAAIPQPPAPPRTPHPG